MKQIIKKTVSQTSPASSIGHDAKHSLQLWYRCTRAAFSDFLEIS